MGVYPQRGPRVGLEFTFHKVCLGDAKGSRCTTVGRVDPPGPSLAGVRAYPKRVSGLCLFPFLSWSGRPVVPRLSSGSDRHTPPLRPPATRSEHPLTHRPSTPGPRPPKVTTDDEDDHRGVVTRETRTVETYPTRGLGVRGGVTGVSTVASS